MTSRRSLVILRSVCTHYMQRHVRRVDAPDILEDTRVAADNFISMCEVVGVAVSSAVPECRISKYSGAAQQNSKCDLSN